MLPCLGFERRAWAASSMSGRNLLFAGGVIGGTGNGERGGLQPPAFVNSDDAMGKDNNKHSGETFYARIKRGRWNWILVPRPRFPNSINLWKSQSDYDASPYLYTKSMTACTVVIFRASSSGILMLNSSSIDITISIRVKSSIPSS